ncbi:MAG TPA: hypothetical protein VFK33_11655 [Bacillales bacterium]|nr:hypothetical protein [Bacillales bacterium]
MVIYLILTILFNLLFLTLVSSKLYKNLHPLEVFTCWLFISGVLQVFKFIIFLNHKWIQCDPGAALFWAFQIDRLVFIPFLTVWLFDQYFSKTWLPAGKVLLTLGWFLILVGFQYFNQLLGFFRFSGWNAVHSLTEWLILYLLASGLLFALRTVLKREAFMT